MIASVKPEANPYSTAKTMIGALEAAGSHRARLITPEKRVKIMQTLKTPYTSPRWAGKILPKMLAALMMGTR